MHALSRTMAASLLLFGWLAAGVAGAAGRLDGPAAWWGVVALAGATAAGLGGYVWQRRRAIGGQTRWRLFTHAGLLLILAAGALSWRFRRGAEFPITEGEEAVLPLAGTRGSAVRLDRLYPSWRGVRLLDCEAFLSFTTGGLRRGVAARLGRPARLEGLAIRQVSPVLPAADIRVESGRRRAATCLSFDPVGEGQYEATWVVPGGDLTLTGRLYPDFILGPSGPTSRSPAATRPRLFARVSRGGRAVAGGVLAPGESFEAEGGRVSFLATRYWTRLRVARDPGAPVAFAGFGMTALGLAGLVVSRWRSPGAAHG